MIRKISALSLIVLVPILSIAEWIQVNNKSAADEPPKVTLLSDNDFSTVLKVEIGGFELNKLNASDRTYEVVDLLSESFTSETGYPSVPYIAEVLAIPDLAGVTIEILEMGDVFTFNDIHLPPARESWMEGSAETPFIENDVAYKSLSAYPSVIAQSDPPAIFRDFRIARISVFPVRYIPAKNELQVASSITIKVNYGKGELVNPKTTAKKKIAPSFGKLYSSFILNYQSVLDQKYSGKEEGHDLMLVVMPDDFYESFQEYAQWKRQSGIDIHITKFSDIGATTTDPDIIRDHIADAYFNWEVAPTYALLIGDAGVVPYFTSSNYVDENHYVEIEGNDFFPEMFIGRFTNQSNYGLLTMVLKFRMYEQTPYTGNMEWFKKGICCSNDAYPSQAETKRFAAERMLVDGGFISVDTMMSDPGCTYSNADVVNAINEGRSHLNYRGEGWTTGWWATCTPMTNSEVQSLANGEKFTFVTSIGCGVAMFASGESFGETWIELGSLTNPRGACAFIGPAGNTHTAYNNNIDKGIYIGMFQEGMNTPGQGLLRGKLYMYTVFGTDPYVQYHYKIYCVLGDPSIHIWKDMPLNVTVDYPATSVVGSGLVQFTVTHTATGQPVENAVVCVTGTDIFCSGTTDTAGIVLLDILAEYPQTLTVTVTGGNVYPFQGTMEIIPPSGPWCIQDYYILNDVAGGDGDSLVDFGESILLSLAMENIGISNATDVSVTLSTSDPYITITDNNNIYSSIPSGQSVLATDVFAFIVADDLPDEHEIIVNVTASSGGDTWNSYFIMQGHAPVLGIGNITITDPQGNNNGLLDPGESATIYIPVSNSGSSPSPEATVYLETISPYITLNNTSYYLGSIGIGAVVSASFDLTVSPSAPVGESIDLKFEVIAGSYDTAKLVMTCIGILIEDWETGNFDKFPWVMGGNADWTIVTDNPQEGIYCARSGNIDNSQISYLEVTVGVTGEGNITFYRKVSSENNYDYLKFFIDGIQKDQWSGNFAWGQVSYPVTAGNHIFKWQYSKDGSVSSGEDCAWIDYIVFPFPTPPVIFTPPYQTDFDESGNIPEGWINDNEDDFDWTIISGPTPSPHTGPEGDHTTGTGYYFYTEATYNNPFFEADLLTPIFDLTELTDVTVSFWYHMWDDNYNTMGTLHLDIGINDVWTEDVMTPISGNQGDQWLEKVIDLSDWEGQVIRLRFRGITGADWASDICIDDFSIIGMNPCPPGDITFASQAEIDSYPADFPDCFEIDGNVEIGGNDITNLDSLGIITTIQGNLEVSDNPNLSGLSGLTNVTAIGGILIIYNNDLLTSLSGIDNIDTASIEELYIVSNDNLSYCNIVNVCDYLASPGATYMIQSNATGCNSFDEVWEACFTSVAEPLSGDGSGFTIIPNPLKSNTLITYTLANDSHITLKIIDLSGSNILTLIDENQHKGKQEVVFNTGGLPAGIYFCVLKTNEGVQQKKMIKL
jgi:hypothetical protein